MKPFNINPTTVCIPYSADHLLIIQELRPLKIKSKTLKGLEARQFLKEQGVKP